MVPQNASISSCPNPFHITSSTISSTLFSLFEIAKARGTAEDRVFEQADGRWRVRPEITVLLDDFHALCNKVKIRHFVEGGVSPDEYCRQTREALEAATRK